MAYPWVKLYTEIIHDPKFGRLPTNAKLLFIELLCITGEYDTDRNGMLPELEDIAWTLRYDEEQLATDMAVLERVGMVQHTDSGWRVTNFKSRQAPITNADRQREHRWRDNNAAGHEGDSDTNGEMPRDENPAVDDEARDESATVDDEARDSAVTIRDKTRNDDVTIRDTDKTRLDLDHTRSDSDVDTEDGANAPTHSAPPGDIPFYGDPPEDGDPEPPEGESDEGVAPKRRRRHVSTPDPRSQHPVILAIQSVSKRMPAKVQYDAIIKALGDDPPNMMRLKLCYDAWVVRGFRPDNLAWATEWYVQGGPPQRSANGRDAPHQKEHTLDEWAAVAKEYEQR